MMEKGGDRFLRDLETVTGFLIHKLPEFQSVYGFGKIF